MIPSESSPISSSAAERIIPSEATPRSFALRSFSPPGIRRPGQGDGDGLAGGDVGRAADDRPRLAVAGVDRADAEPVGVGVRLAGQHPADHEAVAARRAERRHPLDLGPGHRQALGELLGADAGVAVLAQP